MSSDPTAVFKSESYAAIQLSATVSNDPVLKPVVASWSCHCLWLEQWEGAPAERTVRITSAPPAFRAAGAAGKCLVGNSPVNREEHSTKGGHTKQVQEIGPAPRKVSPVKEVKPRTYGSRGSSLVNIGSNNRRP